MYKYVYVQICVQNNMIIKTKYDYMCKIIFVPVHTCTYWIVMKYRCTYDLARLAGVFILLDHGVPTDPQNWRSRS